jgi:hypothetical protein
MLLTAYCSSLVLIVVAAAGLGYLPGVHGQAATRHGTPAPWPYWQVLCIYYRSKTDTVNACYRASFASDTN